MIESVLRNTVILGYEVENGRTVVDTFGDCLENFDIEGGSAAIVPIVLVFVVSDDATRPFRSRKL